MPKRRPSKKSKARPTLALPAHLAEESAVWRLIEARWIDLATATKNNGVSWLEVSNANDWLDMRDAVNALATEED